MRILVFSGMPTAEMYQKEIVGLILYDKIWRIFRFSSLVKIALNEEKLGGKLSFGILVHFDSLNTYLKSVYPSTPLIEREISTSEIVLLTMSIFLSD